MVPHKHVFAGDIRGADTDDAFYNLVEAAVLELFSKGIPHIHVYEGLVVLEEDYEDAVKIVEGVLRGQGP